MGSTKCIIDIDISQFCQRLGKSLIIIGLPAVKRKFSSRQSGQKPWNLQHSQFFLPHNHQEKEQEDQSAGQEPVPLGKAHGGNLLTFRATQMARQYYLGTRLRSFRMVGRAALMRVSSVMEPSASRGTLKSTRTKTRLSLSSKSSIDLIILKSAYQIKSGSQWLPLK